RLDDVLSGVARALGVEKSGRYELTVDKHRRARRARRTLHGDCEDGDLRLGRIERRLRSLARLHEAGRRVRRELLAQHLAQVLRSVDELALRDLTLAEPTENDRRMVEFLRAAQLVDGLGALASVGQP